MMSVAALITVSAIVLPTWQNTVSIFPAVTEPAPISSTVAVQPLQVSVDTTYLQGGEVNATVTE